MSDPNYMHEFDPNRKGLCTIPIPVCPKCGCSNVHVEWSNGQINWINCMGTDSGEFCDMNAACAEEYAKFFSKGD